MILFNIPSTFKVLNKMESTADDSKPLELRTEVYELLDMGTQKKYFFKTNPINDYEFDFNGQNIKMGLNIVKEIFSMGVAKLLGVEVCNFNFAYFPVLDMYGILTESHSGEAYTLHKYLNTLETKYGDKNGDDAKIELISKITDMGAEELIKLFKIHCSDIILLNADRHENNICFTDSSIKHFYPAFDYDYALNTGDIRDLSNKSLRALLSFNLRQFNVINILFCYSVLFCEVDDEEGLKGQYDLEQLMLNIPERSQVQELIDTFSLDTLYDNMPLYIEHIAKELNDFTRESYNKDFMSFMNEMMSYIPTQVQSF